jgi:hypothetical protein
VHESIEHVSFEYTRWECHRRSYGTLARDFMDFVRHFATPFESTTELLLGGVLSFLHGAIILKGMGGLCIYGVMPSLILFSLHFMYRTPEVFCSVRWALLLLAVLKWADARTGREDISWSSPEIHSCLFACFKRFLIGGTPALALMWGWCSTIRFSCNSTL